jgi:F-type H+-transporting ATPase subunit gamma
LADFVFHSLNKFHGKKDVWAVGERVQLRLTEAGFEVTKLFPVPGSVEAITPLVGQILINSQQRVENGYVNEVYIFHNQPKEGAVYTPVMQRLLPLDATWKNTFDKLKWPTKYLPLIAGENKPTLFALIREYLFVSLFKACAESLASENASRLSAMQRAEKNTGELLDELENEFHRLRQSSIDEELFDVVSGFEAMKKERE